MEPVVACIGNIANKMATLFSTIWGWIISLIMAFISFLGDERFAFYSLAIAIGLDMFWGIMASIKRREFVVSRLARDTFYKVLIYGTLTAVLLYIERSLNSDWGIATRVVCVAAASCEVWSSAASMLIVAPNFPFLKLFKKYLAGEIASKLKCSAQDVIDSFNAKNENLNK